MTRIFLDDERFPPEGDDAIIVRNYADFSMLLKEVADGERTLITHVSFDHDLGGEETGMMCARLLVAYDMDKWVMHPENFTFTVHSMNPVGAENIKAYMENYLS